MQQVLNMNPIRAPYSVAYKMSSGVCGGCGAFYVCSDPFLLENGKLLKDLSDRFSSTHLTSINLPKENE